MRVFVLVLVLSAAACGGGSSAGPGTGVPGRLRPAEAPDVLLLSVAGHGGVLSALLCSDEDNTAYLGDPGEAVEALVSAYEFLGLSVDVVDFADRLAAPDADGDGVPDDTRRLGFAELVATLEFARDEWIAGIGNPTRIVLVSHSHGANWAHIATSILPDVPIDTLITLDGVCFGWECEHSAAMADWAAANGPFAFDLAHPCDALSIPGRSGALSAKDVVFPSVRRHLEVHSNSIFPADCCDNVRTDGGTIGLELYRASEGHSDVDAAGGESMAWVVSRVLAE